MSKKHYKQLAKAVTLGLVLGAGLGYTNLVSAAEIKEAGQYDMAHDIPDCWWVEQLPMNIQIDGKNVTYYTVTGGPKYVYSVYDYKYKAGNYSLPDKDRHTKWISDAEVDTNKYLEVPEQKTVSVKEFFNGVVSDIKDLENKNWSSSYYYGLYAYDIDVDGSMVNGGQSVEIQSVNQPAINFTGATTINAQDYLKGTDKKTLGVQVYGGIGLNAGKDKTVSLSNIHINPTYSSRRISDWCLTSEKITVEKKGTQEPQLETTYYTYHFDTLYKAFQADARIVGDEKTSLRLNNVDIWSFVEDGIMEVPGSAIYAVDKSDLNSTTGIVRTQGSYQDGYSRDGYKHAPKYDEINSMGELVGIKNVGSITLDGTNLHFYSNDRFAETYVKDVDGTLIKLSNDVYKRGDDGNYYLSETDVTNQDGSVSHAYVSYKDKDNKDNGAVYWNDGNNYIRLSDATYDTYNSGGTYWAVVDYNDGFLMPYDYNESQVYLYKTYEDQGQTKYIRLEGENGTKYDLYRKVGEDAYVSLDFATYKKIDGAFAKDASDNYTRLYTLNSGKYEVLQYTKGMTLGENVYYKQDDGTYVKFTQNGETIVDGHYVEFVDKNNDKQLPVYEYVNTFTSVEGVNGNFKMKDSSIITDVFTLWGANLGYNYQNEETKAYEYPTYMFAKDYNKLGGYGVKDVTGNVEITGSAAGNASNLVFGEDSDLYGDYILTMSIFTGNTAIENVGGNVTLKDAVIASTGSIMGPGFDDLFSSISFVGGSDDEEHFYNSLGRGVHDVDGYVNSDHSLILSSSDGIADVHNNKDKATNGVHINGAGKFEIGFDRYKLAMIDKDGDGMPDTHVDVLPDKEERSFYYNDKGNLTITSFDFNGDTLPDSEGDKAPAGYVWRADGDGVVQAYTSQIKSLDTSDKAGEAYDVIWMKTEGGTYEAYRREGTVELEEGTVTAIVWKATGEGGALEAWKEETSGSGDFNVKVDAGQDYKGNDIVPVEVPLSGEDIDMVDLDYDGVLETQVQWRKDGYGDWYAYKCAATVNNEEVVWKDTDKDGVLDTAYQKDEKGDFTVKVDDAVIFSEKLDISTSSVVSGWKQKLEGNDKVQWIEDENTGNWTAYKTTVTVGEGDAAKDVAVQWLETGYNKHEAYLTYITVAKEGDETEEVKVQWVKEGSSYVPYKATVEIDGKEVAVQWKYEGDEGGEKWVAYRKNEDGKLVQVEGETPVTITPKEGSDVKVTPTGNVEATLNDLYTAHAYYSVTGPDAAYREPFISFYDGISFDGFSVKAYASLISFRDGVVNVENGNVRMDNGQMLAANRGIAEVNGNVTIYNDPKENLFDNTIYATGTISLSNGRPVPYKVYDDGDKDYVTEVTPLGGLDSIGLSVGVGITMFTGNTAISDVANGNVNITNANIMALNRGIKNIQGDGKGNVTLTNTSLFALSNGIENAAGTVKVTGQNELSLVYGITDAEGKTLTDMPGKDKDGNAITLTPGDQVIGMVHDIVESVKDAAEHELAWDQEELEFWQKESAKGAYDEPEGKSAWRRDTINSAINDYKNHDIPEDKKYIGELTKAADALDPTVENSLGSMLGNVVDLVGTQGKLALSYGIISGGSAITDVGKDVTLEGTSVMALNLDSHPSAAIRNVGGNVKFTNAAPVKLGLYNCQGDVNKPKALVELTVDYGMLSLGDGIVNVDGKVEVENANAIIAADITALSEHQGSAISNVGKNVVVKNTALVAFPGNAVYNVENLKTAGSADKAANNAVDLNGVGQIKLGFNFNGELVETLGDGLLLDGTLLSSIASLINPDEPLSVEIPSVVKDIYLYATGREEVEVEVQKQILDDKGQPVKDDKGKPKYETVKEKQIQTLKDGNKDALDILAGQPEIGLTVQLGVITMGTAVGNVNGGVNITNVPILALGAASGQGAIVNANGDVTVSGQNNIGLALTLDNLATTKEPAKTLLGLSLNFGTITTGDGIANVAGDVKLDGTSLIAMGSGISNAGYKVEFVKDTVTGEFEKDEDSNLKVVDATLDPVTNKGNVKLENSMLLALGGDAVSHTNGGLDITGEGYIGLGLELNPKIVNWVVGFFEPAFDVEKGDYDNTVLGFKEGSNALRKLNDDLEKWAGDGTLNVAVYAGTIAAGSIANDINGDVNIKNNSMVSLGVNSIEDLGMLFGGGEEPGDEGDGPYYLDAISNVKGNVNIQGQGGIGLALVHGHGPNPNAKNQQTILDLSLNSTLFAMNNAVDTVSGSVVVGGSNTKNGSAIIAGGEGFVNIGTPEVKDAAGKVITQKKGGVTINNSLVFTGKDTFENVVGDISISGSGNLSLTLGISLFTDSTGSNVGTKQLINDVVDVLASAHVNDMVDYIMGSEEEQVGKEPTQDPGLIPYSIPLGESISINDVPGLIKDAVAILPEGIGLGLVLNGGLVSGGLIADKVDGNFTMKNTSAISIGMNSVVIDENPDLTAAVNNVSGNADIKGKGTLGLGLLLLDSAKDDAPANLLSLGVDMTMLSMGGVLNNVTGNVTLGGTKTNEGVSIIALGGGVNGVGTYDEDNDVYTTTKNAKGSVTGGNVTVNNAMFVAAGGDAFSNVGGNLSVTGTNSLALNITTGLVGELKPLVNGLVDLLYSEYAPDASKPKVKEKRIQGLDSMLGELLLSPEGIEIDLTEEKFGKLTDKEKTALKNAGFTGDTYEAYCEYYLANAQKDYGAKLLDDVHTSLNNMQGHIHDTLGLGLAVETGMISMGALAENVGGNVTWKNTNGVSIEDNGIVNVGGNVNITGSANTAIHLYGIEDNEMKSWLSLGANYTMIDIGEAAIEGVAGNVTLENASILGTGGIYGIGSFDGAEETLVKGTGDVSLTNTMLVAVAGPAFDSIGGNLSVSGQGTADIFLTLGLLDELNADLGQLLTDISPLVDGLLATKVVQETVNPFLVGGVKEDGTVDYTKALKVSDLTPILSSVFGLLPDRLDIAVTTGIIGGMGLAEDVGGDVTMTNTAAMGLAGGINGVGGNATITGKGTTGLSVLTHNVGSKDTNTLLGLGLNYTAITVGDYLNEVKGNVTLGGAKSGEGVSIIALGGGVNGVGTDEEGTYVVTKNTNGKDIGGNVTMTNSMLVAFDMEGERAAFGDIGGNLTVKGTNNVSLYLTSDLGKYIDNLKPITDVFIGEKALVNTWALIDELTGMKTDEMLGSLADVYMPEDLGMEVVELPADFTKKTTGEKDAFISEKTEGTYTTYKAYTDALEAAAQEIDKDTKGTKFETYAQYTEAVGAAEKAQKDFATKFKKDVATTINNLLYETLPDSVGLGLAVETGMISMGALAENVGGDVTWETTNGVSIGGSGISGVGGDVNITGSANTGVTLYAIENDKTSSLLGIGANYTMLALGTMTGESAAIEDVAGNVNLEGAAILSAGGIYGVGSDADNTGKVTLTNTMFVTTGDPAFGAVGDVSINGQGSMDIYLDLGLVNKLDKDLDKVLTNVSPLVDDILASNLLPKEMLAELGVDKKNLTTENLIKVVDNVFGLLPDRLDIVLTTGVVSGGDCLAYSIDSLNVKDASLLSMGDGFGSILGDATITGKGTTGISILTHNVGSKDTNTLLSLGLNYTAITLGTFIDSAENVTLGGAESGDGVAIVALGDGIHTVGTYDDGLKDYVAKTDDDGNFVTGNATMTNGMLVSAGGNTFSDIAGDLNVSGTGNLSLNLTSDLGKYVDNLKPITDLVIGDKALVDIWTLVGGLTGTPVDEMLGSLAPVAEDATPEQTEKAQKEFAAKFKSDVVTTINNLMYETLPDTVGLGLAVETGMVSVNGALAQSVGGDVNFTDTTGIGAAGVVDVAGNVNITGSGNTALYLYAIEDKAAKDLLSLGLKTSMITFAGPAISEVKGTTELNNASIIALAGGIDNVGEGIVEDAVTGKKPAAVTVTDSMLISAGYPTFANVKGDVKITGTGSLDLFLGLGIVDKLGDDVNKILTAVAPVADDLLQSNLAAGVLPQGLTTKDIADALAVLGNALPSEIGLKLHGGVIAANGITDSIDGNVVIMNSSSFGAVDGVTGVTGDVTVGGTGDFGLDLYAVDAKGRSKKTLLGVATDVSLITMGSAFENITGNVNIGALNDRNVMKGATVISANGVDGAKNVNMNKSTLVAMNTAFVNVGETGTTETDNVVKVIGAGTLSVTLAQELEDEYKSIIGNEVVVKEILPIVGELVAPGTPEFTEKVVGLGDELVKSVTEVVQGFSDQVTDKDIKALLDADKVKVSVSGMSVVSGQFADNEEGNGVKGKVVLKDAAVYGLDDGISNLDYGLTISGGSKISAQVTLDGKVNKNLSDLVTGVIPGAEYEKVSVYAMNGDAITDVHGAVNIKDAVIVARMSAEGDTAGNYRGIYLTQGSDDDVFYMSDSAVFADGKAIRLVDYKNAVIDNVKAVSAFSDGIAVNGTDVRIGVGVDSFIQGATCGLIARNKATVEVVSSANAKKAADTLYIVAGGDEYEPVDGYVAGVEAKSKSVINLNSKLNVDVSAKSGKKAYVLYVDGGTINVNNDIVVVDKGIAEEPVLAGMLAAKGKINLNVGRYVTGDSGVVVAQSKVEKDADGKVTKVIVPARITDGVVISKETPGTVNLAGNAIFASNSKEIFGADNIKGTDIYGDSDKGESAKTVFVEANAEIPTSISYGGILKFTGGTVEIGDEYYTLDYVRNAEDAFASTEGYKNTNLTFTGELVTKSQVTVSDVDGVKSELDNVAVVSSGVPEGSLLIGKELDGTQKEAIKQATGGEKGIQVEETAKEGFSVGSVELAEKATGMVITNQQTITLGGSDANGAEKAKDVVTVKENANAKVNVVVGLDKGTAENIGLGQDKHNATLNIGNAVADATANYQLQGSLTANEDSTINVKGQTKITEGINLNSAALNIAQESKVETPKVNITGVANIAGQGKIVTDMFALDDSTANASKTIVVETKNISVDSTANGGEKKSVITGNVDATGSLTMNKAVDEDVVTLNVGNSENGANVEVAEAKLQGNIIFIDPAWKEGQNLIGDASHFATKTTNIDGAYVVGQNAVLTFGATNAEADKLFGETGLTWGNNAGNITAALYLAKPVTLGDQGSIMVNGALTSPDPVTAKTFTAAANSLTMVNVANITTAAVNGIETDGASVDGAAKLYLQNAKKDTTYTILDAGVSTGWDDANIFGSKITELEGKIVDNAFKVEVKAVEEDGIEFSDCIIPNVAKAMAVANGDSKAYEFMVGATSDLFTGAQQAANINSYANMGENLGVQRGAYDVTNMVANAIQDHYETKEKGENIWGTYTHNKEKVSGLSLGGMNAQYSAQYNGVSVGYDLVDDHDITMGVALHYADGNVSNGLGHNDADYQGLSVYGQKTYGKFVVSGDLTYVHGKNEMTQNAVGMDVTANASTNTISLGGDVRRSFNVGKGSVTPFAGLRYLHISNKGYSDNFGVSHSADGLSTVVLPLGAKYSVEIDDVNGWKVKPFIELGYMLNIGNKSTNVHRGYAGVGDTFGIDVVDRGAFFTKAGISVNKKNVTASLGYDYMKSKNSHNNKWNVGLNFSF